ncbi:hypothetical protein [Enterococcus casseliflavus]|uniref:hypothetical protein n=1 Tax=Enterococcus casseliflavus TaxID=37734 RepID=UPI001CD3B945|nr:hypothetical protein [Enterococcus casseliflavus]
MVSSKQGRRALKRAKLARMVYLAERDDFDTNEAVQQELKRLRSDAAVAKSGRKGLTIQVIEDDKVVFEGNKRAVAEFCGLSKYEVTCRVKTGTKDSKGRSFVLIINTTGGNKND